MRKPLIIAFALLASMLVAGCILTTANIVIDHEISGFISSDLAVDKVLVDLKDNKDYNDHKDKIKSVDAISIVGWVINRGDAPNAGVVWMADSDTLTMPDSTNATRLLVSPSVPAGDSLLVKWSDAFSHIENFDILRYKVEKGDTFWLYGIAKNIPFRMQFRFVLLVTMTVGA